MKTVIFDVDGVLLDSEPVITAASVQALKEYGIQADPGDFRQFAGMGDDIYIGGVARLHGGEYVPEMKARAYEIYAEIAEKQAVVYPGVLPLMDYLWQHGYTLAVASASDSFKVMLNLRTVGAGPERFAAILTGSDVSRKKPFPDIYLEAARKAGAKPEECTVIEDSLAGVQAAKNAGMRCIAVTNTFSADKLVQAGADFVFDRIDDAETIL